MLLLLIAMSTNSAPGRIRHVGEFAQIHSPQTRTVFFCPKGFIFRNRPNFATAKHTQTKQRAQDRFLRLGRQSQGVVTSRMRVKSFGPELGKSAAAVNA